MYKEPKFNYSTALLKEAKKSDIIAEEALWLLRPLLGINLLILGFAPLKFNAKNMKSLR